MATSTDPYNYGQNSVEYNQNGDSYNGSMGAKSNGSIMNAGIQGGGSSTASNNPFEAFLSHAMTLSNYVNGQQPQAGSPNGGQQYQFPQYQYPMGGAGLGGNDNVAGPNVGTGAGPQQQGGYPSGGWQIGSGPAPVNGPLNGVAVGGGYPSPSRPGVVGSIGQPPMVGTWEDPNYDRINGPSSPSRPGVTGTIGQPPAVPGGGLSGIDQGQTPYDTGGYAGPNVSPTGQSGLSGITGDNSTSTAPQSQPWNPGDYKFVPGYGWTASQQEFQDAQNQVQNQSNTPTPTDATHTPTAPVAAPGSPQAGSVQDMLHKLLSPLFQQQQGDLTKQLNANAAVTGDINAGGYSTGTGPSSFNRQLSDLTAQQGSQEAGFLQQANESALQRALQEHLGELGLQGTKYSADQGLLGARAGAAATSSAATTAANASMSNAGLNYNLGLGNLDVSRENNLLGFLSSMYGMTPQMISALLAGSPESLLSGQTVPAGNIVVKP